MNERDPQPGRRSRPEGAGTTGKGTPVPVDVAGDRRGRLTSALFVAGPVIWSVHFMLVYLVVEAGCNGEGPGLRLLAPPVPTVVTLVATAAAALACAACAAFAYRRWRVSPDERAEGRGVEPRDGDSSLAFAGFLLALLGLIAVLFVGLPALVLPAC